MFRAGQIRVAAGIGLLLAAVVPVAGQGEPSGFRFHHVHLNTVNAKKAIDFYAANFNAKRDLLGGKVPAVHAQGKWLLFNVGTGRRTHEQLSRHFL